MLISLGRNRGLSRHFQQNFGAVYKFGVTVQSKGFEQAPDTILQAVQQLQWAGKTAMPLTQEFIRSTEGPIAELHTGNVDFNECLALGYMSNDRINVSHQILQDYIQGTDHDNSTMMTERKNADPR